MLLKFGLDIPKRIVVFDIVSGDVSKFVDDDVHHIVYFSFRAHGDFFTTIQGYANVFVPPVESFYFERRFKYTCSVFIFFF